jgi:hypothetical protein
VVFPTPPLPLMAIFIGLLLKLAELTQVIIENMFLRR